MIDETVRRVLVRIEESYVEPGRIDPGTMFEAAARAVGESVEGGTGASLDGSGGLVSSLAPALERVLDLGASGSREQRRAKLLGAALSTLDRYSRAVTGAARTRLLDRYTGTTCGIGVRVGRREGRIRVLRCFARGAAYTAGVRPGDVLTAIDDRDLDDRPVTDALRALRGPQGSTVTIRLDRQPPVELVMMRRPFATPSLTAAVTGDGVAQLRLERLSKATPREVGRWLVSIPANTRLAGVVLDLRGNKGGSMLAAADVADRFVRRGILVEALDRDGRVVPGLASRVEAGAGSKPDWPVAVLLDGATSSAAELLAAALAWNDRAILVGSRSFGKTTVLKLYHYPQDDLTLRLAVAYMRAAGRRLEPGGLVPDFVVDASNDDAEAVPGIARRLILRHGRASRAEWLQRISCG